MKNLRLKSLMIICILSITQEYIQNKNYYTEIQDIICKIYHKDENSEDHYDDDFCLADQYVQDNMRKPAINYWFNPRVLTFTIQLI